jgi:hypothetical protein
MNLLKCAGRPSPEFKRAVYSFELPSTIKGRYSIGIDLSPRSAGVLPTDDIIRSRLLSVHLVHERLIGVLYSYSHSI